MQPGTDTAVVLHTFDECDRKADRLRRGYVDLATNVIEDGKLGERTHDEDVKLTAADLQLGAQELLDTIDGQLTLLSGPVAPTGLPTDIQGRYQQMRTDMAAVLKYAATVLASRTG
ncbi:hypothetical protein [Micromonospora coxensis]|uniref:Uncharacterized protein n=1 Tax=Micromonospora coxensis TaxID=356852 RepID=A0A1C5HK32_9ACTN|nr:hypothetical protein [Micromonospora coxensis]SCG46328.1 hypothetical protein GA0070614_1421 [Micromonospora coxensis]